MFEPKKILIEGNPILRKKCKAVKKPYSQEDIDLALYLHEYVKCSTQEEYIEKYNLRAGVGLAAPQIGINKKIIAIYIEYKDEEGNVEDVTEFALINPEMISHSSRKAYLLAGEGCLSVENNYEGIVPRYANVTVRGYDALLKEEIIIRLRGYEAIVIQHELDHLEGVLFFDRIDKKEPQKRIEGALEL